eukprot:s96_g2.t1
MTVLTGTGRVNTWLKGTCLATASSRTLVKRRRSRVPEDLGPEVTDSLKTAAASRHSTTHVSDYNLLALVSRLGAHCLLPVEYDFFADYKAIRMHVWSESRERGRLAEEGGVIPADQNITDIAWAVKQYTEDWTSSTGRVNFASRGSGGTRPCNPPGTRLGGPPTDRCVSKALLPDPVCRNFYAELLRWPNRYRDYFCCERPADAAIASGRPAWKDDLGLGFLEEKGSL